MGNHYDAFVGKIEHQPFQSNTTSKSEIVAAPGSGYRLRIHGFVMAAETGVAAQFFAGTTGTSLSGKLYMGDGQCIGVERAGIPALADLPENVPLVIQLDAQQQVGGIVYYRTIEV